MESELDLVIATENLKASRREEIKANVMVEAFKPLVERPPNPLAFASQGPDGGQYGMSLRDYFAAVAFGQWVKAHIDASVDDLDKETIAREAYRYADAMLKERDKS